MPGWTSLRTNRWIRIAPYFSFPMSLRLRTSPARPTALLAAGPLASSRTLTESPGDSSLCIALIYRNNQALNQSTPAKATSSSSGPYIYLVSSIAAIAGFLFGYDLSIVSGAVIFLRTYFHLSAFQLGFAVSSASIGCILGPVLGGPLSDWIGRKRALYLTGIIFGVGVIGTVLPRSINEFNFYRIIGGVGVGLGSVLAPMYIAEISPAEMRGRLVSVNQLAIVIGSLSSIVVSYFLSFTGSWRTMFATECLPIVLLLVGLTFVPESPRWLVKSGQLVTARRVLEKFEDPDRAREECVRIAGSIREETGGFWELVQRGTRTALIIAVVLAVFQQITGVSPITFYMPIVFQRAGFVSASSAIGESIIVNVWNLICTIIAFWLIDRAGRRPLFLVGTAGMAIGLFSLGTLFRVRLTGIPVVLVMILCIGFYALSLAPLTWLTISEVFPTRVRGMGMAIATVFLWLATYGSAQAFPLLGHHFERTSGTPAGVFWIFGIICIAAFLFCWRVVPETKGRSLEDIARSWKRA